MAPSALSKTGLGLESGDWRSTVIRRRNASKCTKSHIKFQKFSRAIPPNLHQLLVLHPNHRGRGKGKGERYEGRGKRRYEGRGKR